MISQILEYEDDRVRVTANAYAIPEIKAILDKYKDKAEPYIQYVWAYTSPVSAYINTPAEEKEETIIYDIQETIGEFDWEDDLVKNAIEKLKDLYQTPNMKLAQELGQELLRITNLLQTEPLTMGDGGNFKERMSLMEKIDKISSNYTKVKAEADKEMGSATKGDHEVGEY